MRLLTVLCLLFFISSISWAHDRPLRVFICGDILLGQRTEGIVHSPTSPAALFHPEIAQADIAFGNLECALTENSTPRVGRLRLMAKPDASVLQEAGFSLVSNANNHGLDAGEEGVRTTLAALDRAGVVGLGAKVGDGPWNPWMVTIRGRQIAWLAASEHGPFQAGDAHLRSLAGTGLLQQVHELSKKSLVFVSLHWGIEFQKEPSLGQIETAHALIDAGAKVVVGHHPHVAQRVERYHGGLIFYSLGNFLFDKSPVGPTSGLAATVTVDGDQATCTAVSLPLPPLPPVAQGETRRQTLFGHFIASDDLQAVVWSEAKDGTSRLRAWRWSGEQWKLIAEGHHPKITQVEVGDVDGDRRDDIALGLVERSKLDPTVMARIHIYDVGENDFVPRWRGSTLSRPFRNWHLFNHNGVADIVALENDPKKANFHWLSLYGWNSFGFARVWDAPVIGPTPTWQLGRENGAPCLIVTQASKRRRVIVRPGAAESSQTTTGETNDAPLR